MLIAGGGLLQAPKSSYLVQGRWRGDCRGSNNHGRCQASSQCYRRWHAVDFDSNRTTSHGSELPVILPARASARTRTIASVADAGPRNRLFGGMISGKTSTAPRALIHTNANQHRQFGRFVQFLEEFLQDQPAGSCTDYSNRELFNSSGTASPGKSLRFRSTLFQNRGREKCACVSWQVPSTHQTCGLCEDTMLVFKTIFYRPAVGFEGVGTIDILGPRIHNLRSGQRVAVVNVKAGN
jgi:hypothetical protein